MKEEDKAKEAAKKTLPPAEWQDGKDCLAGLSIVAGATSAFGHCGFQISQSLLDWGNFWIKHSQFVKLASPGFGPESVQFLGKKWKRSSVEQCLLDHLDSEGIEHVKA